MVCYALGREFRALVTTIGPNIDALEKELCLYSKSVSKIMCSNLKLVAKIGMETSFYLDGRHSSVDPSTPTILQPRVGIPSPTLAFFSIDILTRKGRK